MVIDYEKLEAQAINEFNNWVRELEHFDEKQNRKTDKKQRSIGIYDKEFNQEVAGMRSRKNALKTQIRDKEKKLTSRKGITLVELAQNEFNNILDDIRNIEDRESQINNKFDINQKFGVSEYKVDKALDTEEYLATYKTYRKALEYVPKDTWNLAKSIKIKNNTVYVDLDQAPYGLYVHEASAWRHNNGTYDFLFRAAREVQGEMNSYLYKRTDEFYIEILYYLGDNRLAVEFIASEDRVNKNTDEYEYINMDRKLYKKYKRNKKTSKDNYKTFLKSDWYRKNEAKLMEAYKEKQNKKLMKKYAQELEIESLEGSEDYDNEF